MCKALTENDLLQNTAMLISDNVYKKMFQITQLLSVSKRKLQSTSNSTTLSFHVLSFPDHDFRQR